MSMTRREFAAASTSLIALSVLGCDQSAPQNTASGSTDKEDHEANLAKEPFLIGPLDQYKDPGVYEQYKQDKGVWIVSDGKELIALSATCTHMGCTTEFKQADNLFECPCHHSKFEMQGYVDHNSKAKRSLERCTVTIVDGQVRVDPTQRLSVGRDEAVMAQFFVTL